MLALMGALQVADGDGVRLLTLNRPDALNSFNDELWDATRDALLDAQAREDIKCVVLTGTGRAFTAGQDLGEMAAPPSHDDNELHGYRGFIPVLEEFDKPLLAAVNGIGVGIGITALAFCDLVVMAESARLKAPFVSLGVTTEAAGSVSLPARMGWAAAAHLIFTGGWLSSAEALACGLAWRVVPDADLLDETMALARTIGAQPVGALTATKRLMVAGRLDQWRAARVREDSEFVRLVGAPENLAALEAFFNK
jgi:enoyl-CoA hydratase/carnithine racemase